MNSAGSIRLKNQFSALWKRCLSYRKQDWDLNDYPVMLREQKFDPRLSSPRFKQQRYVAYIVNWAVTGGGDSVADALHNLRINFEMIKDRRKKEGKPAIRPGVRMPIEFASHERVATNQELSEDFTRRVLNLEWAWFSDESTLWDFHTDETNEKLCSKIMEVYGIDVSDIKSAKLAEILDRIAENGRQQA